MTFQKVVCGANLQTKWTTLVQGYKKYENSVWGPCLFGKMCAYMLTLWLIEDAYGSKLIKMYSLVPIRRHVTIISHASRRISVGRPLELDIKRTEIQHCKSTFGIRPSIEFGIRPLEIDIINSVRQQIKGWQYEEFGIRHNQKNWGWK